MNRESNRILEMRKEFLGDVPADAVSEIDSGSKGPGFVRWSRLLAWIAASVAPAPVSFAPFDAGDISADGAIVFANGSFQKCVTDGVEPISITGGSEGAKLELWVTDSGSGCTVTTAAHIPDGSTFTGQVLTAGQRCIMLFRHNGTDWDLVSVTGNF
jgi:hypothetical protein